MMEPLSALGLASAIIQFVDFSSKILKAGYEIHRNFPEGITTEYVDLEELTESLFALQDRLCPSPITVTTQATDQQELEKLATKCQTLANELLLLLNDLKVKGIGLRRTWDSIRQGCRTVWKEKKIARLERLLNHISGQIDSRMVHMICNETSGMSKQIRSLDRTCASLKLDIQSGLNAARSSLMSELKAQSAALRSMKTTLDNDQSRHSHHEAAKAYYASLQALPVHIQSLRHEAGKVATSQQILKSLQYDKMHDREHQIQEAYGKTFDWIFKDDTTSFKQWLTSSNGVFWVNGKAGSGKSTLMKFLAQNRNTRQLLQQWAGCERMVFATYFFWSSGLSMQKSQLGLLQSLLHQILRQCPELIPIASTRRWKADNDLPEECDRWTHSELSSAIENILSQGRLTSRFCFFVDGLDEYAGDQFALIRDFDRLSQSPQVKLCVSSRPWNVFRERYGNIETLRLTLEHLTLTDMHEYVQGMLQGDDRFCRLAARQPQALSLVPHIRDRAEGVFLWVFLVVRSLLRGLDDQDDTSELESRLAQMPSDLNGYFRKIIDTIDPAYRVATVRAFQLATIAVPMPLMVFRHISHELENSRYAIEAGVKALSRNDIEASAERAKALVNKWCRDLLEVKWGYHEEICDYEERVYFLHRTVKDFLLSEEMDVEFLRHEVCHSRPRQAVCMMHLAQTKALSDCSTEKRLRTFERSVDNVMHWAKQCEDHHGKSPHEVLDEL